MKERSHMYRRKAKRDKIKDRMKIMTFGYKPSVGYTDWDWETGVYGPVGNYVKYPRSSAKQKYWKRYSSKGVRKYQGMLPKGNLYRKCAEYQWRMD